ncbi:hypothetical protein DL95DRAFT_446050 [Leptodontidium sp. 2 PMI_412]|nr:hypothetical protein DL95DRAFT_446050 [Leptodontidium sp. 2 PMI_412]
MSSDHASKGAAVLATSAIFLILAVLAVLGRMIARFSFLKNGGGGDDIAIVIALCLWVAIVAYNLALTCIKISIILQYLRIFVGRSIRFWCWASIVLVTLYGLETFILAFVGCIPIHSFWTGGGKCINMKFIWFFNAALNILTDIIILVLPMPVLSSLRLPTKQKIGLMFVFALGGFTCLTSVLRLHSLYIAANTKDLAWDNVSTAIWSSIEVTTGIIYRDHKTVTRVEIGSGMYGERDLEEGSIGDEIRSRNINGSGNGNGNVIGKDIFVTTSMTQDVERKSEMGSEKDLIIQHN